MIGEYTSTEKEEIQILNESCKSNNDKKGLKVGN